MSKFLLTTAVLAASAIHSAALEDHHQHSHDQAAPTGQGDWLEPFEHVHFSKSGTPVVHSFGIEPALTGRDFFLSHRYRKGDGTHEHEIEAELEWALTRRLGLIFELPYAYVDEESVGTSEGFGDLAIVPRALVYESERFLLTAQVEVIAPTGDDEIGGETSIAPGFAAWLDLGNWWTLNSQASVEHVFAEDSSEFVFGFGLVKTFGKSGVATHSHSHHSSVGLLNLHAEVAGTVGLNGDEKGRINAEGLLGISYGLSSRLDIRAAYEFPLTSPEDFDHGVVTGIIYHF
ncbi:hypothetical protein ACFSSA_05085 [Luteolibacter algae]|uniref:Transporter n=1 Tax=Luteolibacter algae TaxID=454151 RepID=A0ABW5D4T6_9BACT